MRQSSGRMSGFIVAVVLLGASSAPVAATPARQQGALVTLVHGVRGLVADIYIDGEVALEVFQPERLTDPLPMAAGEHVVEVRPTGESATSTALLRKTIEVPASGRYSAAVHLAADGSPALSVFEDDLSPVAANEARAVVRHTAAAPAIDVSLGTRQVATGLRNGAQASTVLPAGDQSVSVTSGGQPLITPTQSSLGGGTVRFLYVIGSAEDADVILLAQEVDGLGTSPRSVNTGRGGLAAPAPFPAAAVGALAAVGLAALAWMSRHARV